MISDSISNFIPENSLGGKKKVKEKLPCLTLDFLPACLPSCLPTYLPSVFL
jgi:hypothetical protein